MKKAFDQTVRDLKREVNKKVLKVPSIEQKVLDATSNEPWGPHGSLLADIAQATRNYHEYQMIMSVIWKRINDTGKNWRHVYKALTVLDYMVAHGSERVIDEIREHAYQISTLSDFQYIDSNGRDQGSNVRKKSQSLVVLVNDKERIQEVRQKAAANRDKYRNTSGGSMYRPGSGTGGYGDRYDDEGRFGARDDRNGYGREKEWGDDKYRNNDSYGRDGDRYGEERYSRDGYRDDDYQGRGRSVDDYNYGSRSRSVDRERDRSYEDDGQYSYRGSSAKGDDHSQDGSVAGKRIERKLSEQNLGAPPSYEDAVGDGRSPAHSERDGEAAAAFASKLSPPPVSTNQSTSTVIGSPAAPASASPPPASAPAPVATSPQSPTPATANKSVNGFDEFDPRGSFPAAQATSSGAEVDLLGSLSDSFGSSPLAIVPAATATTEANPASNGPGQIFVAASSASNVSSQPFDDPFGDGPFRAIPSTVGLSAQPQMTAASSFANQPSQQVAQNVETVNNFGFEDTFSAQNQSPYSLSNNQAPSISPHYPNQELQAPSQSTDILADILPPSGPPPSIPSQTGFQAQAGQFPAQAGFPPQQPGQPFHSSFPVQPGQSFVAQVGPSGFPSQSGQPPSLSGFPATGGQTTLPSGNFYGTNQPQMGSPAITTAVSSTAQYNTSNYFQQSQNQSSQPPLSASTGALAIVPQPTKDKFETKSTVWADTLNRGLVNLNISGSKTNPLADIGIDFEAINRKEKRMEKPSTTPMTSNVTMGKAMGSGSGMGRAAASVLRAPANPMMGSGMAMGGGPAIGGYGVNQPMGMGMNVPMNMGMGMNMGQGMQMRPPAGYAPGPGYNSMMGAGAYGQQPYGTGYR